MTYVKKIGKALFLNVIEVIIFLFILTLLYHFNYLDDRHYSFYKLCILLGSIFINSVLIGRKTLKKGYLEGIKYGFLILILFLVPCIYFSKFRLSVIIFYGLIIMTSVIGSIIGISTKKKRN